MAAGLGKKTGVRENWNGFQSDSLRHLLPSYSHYPSSSDIYQFLVLSVCAIAALKDGYANGSGSMVEANPDLMKRPLRERLIHMLAIRSYKKPELVSRLHKGKVFSASNLIV